MFADVLHLDRVAQVGLVGAIPLQAVAVGDQRPVTGHRPTAAEFLENALDHRLHGGKDIRLLDKAHLDIKLVKVGRAAVGARVFVAKTRRDLEIAIEPRHHDQLLELLRGLRQGVELARMQARGHQKVARAFGAGGRDDRGLELGKALIPHALAHAAHHVRAQHHVGVQLVAAQVEKAVGQAGFLGVINLAEHRQRQVVRRPQHRHGTGVNLDRAGRQLGVDQAGVTRLDHAIDADHPFRAHRRHRGKGRAVAVGDHLSDAVVIAQVDEQHPAMVAHPVHPARQADLVADLGQSQLRTCVAAIGMH